VLSGPFLLFDYHSRRKKDKGRNLTLMIHQRGRRGLREFIGIRILGSRKNFSGNSPFPYLFAEKLVAESVPSLHSIPEI
jgi:hypothetical protein